MSVKTDIAQSMKYRKFSDRIRSQNLALSTGIITNSQEKVLKYCRKAINFYCENCLWVFSAMTGNLKQFLHWDLG